MYQRNLRHSPQRYSSVAARGTCRLLLTLALTTGMFSATLATANEPGRGLTAEFEVMYMMLLADHHLIGIREAQLCQQKAQKPQLIALCRGNGAVQAGELLTVKRLLNQWYGIQYEPQISPEAQLTINELASRPNGAEFEMAFMQEFSRHHFLIVKQSVRCLVGSELTHEDLQKLCRDVVDFQLSDIDEMRNLLCDKFNICDYQPFGEGGRHS